MSYGIENVMEKSSWCSSCSKGQHKSCKRKKLLVKTGKLCGFLSAMVKKHESSNL